MKPKGTFVAMYSRLCKLIKETTAPTYVEPKETVFKTVWDHLDIYGVFVTSSASQNTLYYVG